mmetsp:Transcript_3962/g.14990  ORF Transcript_3962/g.14990 Transcript_3962/m.14990 type:complete len:84 (-) Transcript_3962:440-691(-)
MTWRPSGATKIPWRSMSTYCPRACIFRYRDPRGKRKDEPAALFAKRADALFLQCGPCSPHDCEHSSSVTKKTIRDPTQNEFHP